MSEHTPGPWAEGRHGAIVGGPDFEFARGAGRKQIAMACVVPEGVDGTQEGNARLIAAAPELLEACKEALQALEALQGGCTDHEDGTVDALTVWCPEVTEKLSAAIAKAEGQS
jgi:hypothetical protein